MAELLERMDKLIEYLCEEVREQGLANIVYDAEELLKSQQERIDNMRSLLSEADEEIERLKAEAEKAFISGQNNMLEAQTEGR